MKKIFSASIRLPNQEILGDIPEPGDKKRKKPEIETWMGKRKKKIGELIDGVLAKLNPQMHALVYETNRRPDCSAKMGGGENLNQGQCAPEIRLISEEEYRAIKPFGKVAKVDITTTATTTNKDTE